MGLGGSLGLTGAGPVAAGAAAVMGPGTGTGADDCIFEMKYETKG